MTTKVRIAIVLLLLVPPVAATATLWVEGDLFYLPESGDFDGPTRLTQGKRIREFKLSPDKKSVATIESVEGPLLFSPDHDVEPQEIWIQQLKGGARRRLARTPLAKDEASLYGLHFSPDGERLYFQSRCAVVVSCVHVVNIDGGNPVLFSDGFVLDVIDGGPFRGHLVVQQHRYYPEGGSYQEAVLLSPNGVEVFDIGDAENAQLLFRFHDMVRQPRNADGSHPVDAMVRSIGRDTSATPSPPRKIETPNTHDSTPASNP